MSGGGDGEHLAAAVSAAIAAADIACLLLRCADGVHLSMAVGYDEARHRLGPDVIVGVACGTRDDAITVADGGADYVAFGDFDDPTPAAATIDLTAWWAEIMTVP
ncbi:MAG: thiamine phosphate synthase, partial [Dongiaceae bacterium]